MPLFKKSVQLSADLEQVFQFHHNPANLEHVQPPGVQVIEADLPDLLEQGSVCSMQVKVPFGVQYWKICVDKLSVSPDGQSAIMTDRAITSPFALWVHSHCFVQNSAGTVMQDEVEFSMPGGVWSALLNVPARLMLHVLFMFRHYKTVRYFEIVKVSGKGAGS